MAVHNIIPSTNVSMADIRDTLNANGGNVDNTLGSFFKDAAKINKWAKYKPVSYKGDFPANGVQWKGDANSTLWGLQVGIKNDAQSQKGPKDMYDDSGMPNYEYDAPVGGANSPYRLQDFCGYYPKAKAITINTMAKDTVRTIYVSSTAQKTDKIFFTACCGGNNGEIKFSDIEEVARLDSSYVLYLVISVYKKGTSTLIGEYFNNGIILHDYTTANIDNTYDTVTTVKEASISFTKSQWSANSEMDIYLSLQTIRKESTPNGNFYHADKIIAIPYSTNNYFKESIRISTAYRYIRAIKILDPTVTGTRNWLDLKPSAAFRLYDNAGTPDIMFEVSKMDTADGALTLQNGVRFFRSKYRKTNGSWQIQNGTLRNSAGSLISSTTIEKGNGIVNVYYNFGDMFDEPSHSEGYYPDGQYTAEIYLVDTSGSKTTEQMVTIITIYTK